MPKEGAKQPGPEPRKCEAADAATKGAEAGRDIYCGMLQSRSVVLHLALSNSAQRTVISAAVGWVWRNLLNPAQGRSISYFGLGWCVAAS